MNTQQQQQQQFFKESIGIPPANPSVTAAAWNDYRIRVSEAGIDKAALPIACAPSPVRAPATIDDIDEFLRFVDHPNSRLVNVRQPWASLLFGPKDVENRPNRLLPNSTTDDPHCFVAIVASKVETLTARYFNDSIIDATRRVVWSNLPVLQSMPQQIEPISTYRRQYSSQKIVGMIKFRCYKRNEWDTYAGPASIWNNGDRFAWRVVKSIKFDEPIPAGRGSLGIVKLSPNPEAPHALKMAKLRAEIAGQLMRARFAASLRNQPEAAAEA